LFEEYNPIINYHQDLRNRRYSEEIKFSELEVLLNFKISLVNYENENYVSKLQNIHFTEDALSEIQKIAYGSENNSPTPEK